MSDDDLREAARDAGLPVGETIQTVGRCPVCDTELPDDDPTALNLGLPEYCSLAWRLEAEDPA